MIQTCLRCRKAAPEVEFSTPTAAYCETTCWPYLMDNGRKFSEWCAESIANANGSGRGGTFSA